MKIIISPAKKMRVENNILDTAGKPVFLEDTKKLHARLAALGPDELKELFRANDSIVRLNYERFQSMDLERGTTPAVLAYVGLQYQSMAPDVFEEKQWDYVRRQLAILSGFYGILGACDGVVPYRLEMQAKLSMGEKRDLYEFWGDRLHRELTKEDPIVLNLASKEYSRAVEPYIKEEEQFITCVFGTVQGSRVRVKATEAKMARGDMVRWLASRQIQNVERVKDYCGMNYRFSEEHSTAVELVFLKNDLS